MSKSNIQFQNAQFTLYYLLMSIDGEISEKEKTVFIDTVSRMGGFTKSYSECLFNAMHRCASTLNYKFAIENLKQGSTEENDATIKVMRELSFADGSYHKNEMDFILKVQKDLGISVTLATS